MGTIHRIVRDWWNSRLGASMLWQLAALLAAWHLYSLARFVIRNQEIDAFRNATSIIEAEQAIGLQFERAIQQLVVSWQPFVHFIGYYYVYAHFAPLVLCLAWLYVRHPPEYVRFRNGLLVAMGIGFVLHAAFPLAPPRMMRQLGMIDTLHVYGPSVYGTDRGAGIANQFAAMPSFHVGWAALVAGAIIVAGRSRWRWVVLVHPLLMSVAVVATANHYWLDGLVGVMVIFAGLSLAAVMHDRLARTAPPDRAVASAG